MAFALTTQPDLAGSNGAEQVRQAIVLARRAYYEDPAGVLAEAIRCHEIARSFDHTALCARARALQGAVSLHRRPGAGSRVADLHTTGHLPGVRQRRGPRFGGPSELQLSLERATLETTAARRERDALAAKNRQLAEAHAELERRANQLEGLQEQLREQAERDWLTGLHNRRYLARELERLTEERLAVPLSLAVLDLDHFKSINDRFGHDTGDQGLVRVAGLLCDVLRTGDIVVRSGGEEFLILMPLTDARAAAACCERIRSAALRRQAPRPRLRRQRLTRRRRALKTRCTPVRREEAPAVAEDRSGSDRRSRFPASRVRLAGRG